MKQGGLDRRSDALHLIGFGLRGDQPQSRGTGYPPQGRQVDIAVPRLVALFHPGILPGIP